MILILGSNMHSSPVTNGNKSVMDMRNPFLNFGFNKGSLFVLLCFKNPQLEQILIVIASYI